MLLSSGFTDEAYERYGLTANQTGTYLATFRAVAAKYPHKTAVDILSDLVESTPGEEGKGFAAAKEACLYDEALVPSTSLMAPHATVAHRYPRLRGNLRPVIRGNSALPALSA